MKKNCFIFLLFISSLSFAQEDIVIKIVRLRQLVNSVGTEKEALSLVKQIENQCLESNNDTLKAIFLELKGQALLNDEQYEECIPICKDAITLFAKVNLRQYEYLDAWYTIATALHRLKDYTNAERYYRKGILHSVAAKVDKVEQYRSNLYLNLGNLYKEQGDSLLAEECYRRVENNSEIELIDIDHWNYVDWENSYWDKIDELTHAEKYQEAVDVYSEMIPGIQKNKGKNKTYILAVYSRGILLSRYLDKIDEAISLFQELVHLSDSIAEYDENICGSYCNLALCYSMKGLYLNVDETIKQALPYLEKANNDIYRPHTIYRLVGNGAYWNQDYQNAIKYYEKYLAPTNKRETGTNYEEIVNQLSVSYILSGQPAKAETLLCDFIKNDEPKLIKEDSPILANVYHNLGRAYMLNGAKSNALKYLNKSKERQIKLYGEASERTLQYITELNSK